MRHRDRRAARHRGRRVIAGTALIAVLGGLSIAGFAIHLAHHGKTVDVVGLTGMFIGLLGVLATLAQLFLSLAPPPGNVSRTVQLEHAMAELAEAVRVQWERESIVRALRNPTPIQVRWSTAAPAEGTDQGPARPPQPRNSGRATGKLSDITRKFRQLPGRQLFIIGVPGSGKTATTLLFTLSMLEMRAEDEAVPVLLSPVGWEPSAQSFQKWLGDEILANYPALSETSQFGADAAHRLIATGRILPVIDGLDEISEPLRAAALNGIATEWGHQPIVLTCRTEEYQALSRVARALTGSTTVYLKPVSQAERIAYLTQNHRAEDTDRWRPLIENMQQHPHGEVAKALSTPLMMNLVYAVYATKGNATELTDAKAYPNKGSIEGHLLDSFIDIVYSGAPLPPMLEMQPGLANGTRQDPAKARAWLAEIARHLDSAHTRDIAWWLMYRAIPWGHARFGFAAAITMTGASAALLISASIVPIGTALLITLIIGVASLAAAVIPLHFESIPGQPVRAAIRVRIDADRLQRRTPFVLGALFGIPIGVLVSFALGPVSGVYCGLITGILGALVGGIGRWSLPADNAIAVSPRSTHTFDRRAYLFHVAAVATPVGAIVGIALSAHHDAAVGAYAAVVSGIASGIIASMGSAYAWFGGTRVWLGITGRLPWRLMGFLDDAHRRGLLRQNGAVYQFRHVRLQERLVLSTQPPGQVPLPSGRPPRRT